MELLPLVREAQSPGREHAIGRSDVVEDRLFGIKSRRVLPRRRRHDTVTAHRDLQNLVQSRETIQLRELLGRALRGAVYMGATGSRPAARHCKASSADAKARSRRGGGSSFTRGAARSWAGGSSHSLYDSRLANQSNLELFREPVAQGFTSLWALPARLAARLQRRKLRETGKNEPYKRPVVAEDIE